MYNEINTVCRIYKNLGYTSNYEVKDLIKRSCFPIKFKLGPEVLTEKHTFDNVTLEHLVMEPLILNIVIVWSDIPSAVTFAFEELGMKEGPELDGDGLSSQRYFTSENFTHLKPPSTLLQSNLMF